MNPAENKAGFMIFPVSNGLLKRISKDLKKRGFKYVGEITIYSHLQACGIITIILLTLMFAGCGIQEETADMPLPDGKMTVGKDIRIEDITDFYYTEENINYGAYYQRYRLYVEDGKHMFFHETRERRNDYGPCTEDDTTMIGTIELTDEQWSQFAEIVSNGIVKAREDSADSGDTGPWLYLYWTDDKGKYQQFSFDSYGAEVKFEEFCLGLAPKTEKASVVETYEVTDPELVEEYYAEGELVTVVRYYEMSDGTWQTDDHTYKYRLEISGRMNNAAKDSTFVYLSNLYNITFEQAYMAAGLSSNMDDYFDPEEAVLVAMK